jgi:ABC-2 type transport system permease protein
MIRHRLTEIYVLTLRELKKWYRSPFLLMMTLVQPVIWMGLFGKALNLTGLLRIPDELLNQLPPNITSQIAAVFNTVLSKLFGSAEVDYFTYMSVGMVSIVILFTSMSSGMGIAWDRRLGFLNKLLAAPIWRGSIIISRVLAGVFRSVVQATMLLLVAIALGARYDPLWPLGPLAAFLSLFMLSLGLASLFIALGVRLKSWESQMAVMNLLNLPLMFASNALYPLDMMPAWLRAVAQANPISYAVDTVRQTLVLGTAANTSTILINLGAVTIFALALTAAGIALAEGGLRRK